MEQPKKAVIIGGGFGGFYAARVLLKHQLAVTLVNETEFFTFSPLLIEVASGVLEPSDIRIKLTEYFKHKNFTLVQGQARKIDFQAQQISVGGQLFAYDYLVLAMGSQAKTLPVQGSSHSLSLKTMADALAIRRALDQAVKASGAELHINIIGAGPTGVELIFGLEQLMRRLGTAQRPHFHIYNAAAPLFPFFSDGTRRYVRRLLKKSSIVLHDNTIVEVLEQKRIVTASGTFPTDLTVVAIGVVPRTELVPKEKLDEQGNVLVNQCLQLKGHPNVFAVGDITDFMHANIPKLAQTAVQHGKLAALNIIRLAAGKTPQAYRPKIKGRLLSLGEGRAVLEVPLVHLRGIPVYLIRLATYIWKMPKLTAKVNLLFVWLFAKYRRLKI